LVEKAMSREQPSATATDLDQPECDAIVIGAGMTGLYQLHKLREMGMTVLVLEAGADVGGTWYWNRYPGARFDSESYTYQYSFPKQVLDEWDWSEHFAAQPEILRYIDRVADVYDLRKSIRFSSLVTRADWNEPGQFWRVRLLDGATFTTRFLITAMGVLSVPTPARLPGLETFGGISFHTRDWPEGLDLAGKRVAVIGTGSTGVQVISTIARDVSELTVFQRHPSWGAPLGNGPITPGEMARIRAGYEELFALCDSTPSGFMHPPDRRRIANVPARERLEFWEELYERRGFAILFSNFLDVIVDEQANKLLSDFIAQKIRKRVHDPVTAEKLIPRDHGFGTRRVVLETNYYEVYNEDNVRLVDLLETPIERVTNDVIVTSNGSAYPVDVIVLATGFDAITGGFDRIDFRGVGGQGLREKWADSPLTYLGVQSHGFPNLLILTGPQAGSGASNFPRGIEVAVNWVSGLVGYMRQHGYTRVEATEDAERAWLEEVRRRLDRILMGKSKGYFNGFNSNIAGRDRPRLLLYMGGHAKYAEKIQAVADAGYDGFEFARPRPPD
jgi:cation diffusion facilitator CzcD-associated flavoprotein CzcO